MIIQDVNVSLHTIVHNAGHATSNEFGEVDYDEFDRLFNANVKAPYFITQSLIGLIESNGRIINLSSDVTCIIFPYMMIYSMTKGQLIQ
ncbi:short chain dehydrogenase family protein [Bacillus clarus]|uniref:Short chain dehydrogenase family protein n=1 Tax=Bacillus clarus TaxID=2338372 RepID=A0A090YLW1_9BACI|nr:short chain dehydrogenase family protein [Bacillus clarus]